MLRIHVICDRRVIEVRVSTGEGMHVGILSARIDQAILQVAITILGTCGQIQDFSAHKALSVSLFYGLFPGFFFSFVFAVRDPQFSTMSYNNLFLLLCFLPYVSVSSFQRPRWHEFILEMLFLFKERYDSEKRIDQWNKNSSKFFNTKYTSGLILCLIPLAEVVVMFLDKEAIGNLLSQCVLKTRSIIEQWQVVCKENLTKCQWGPTMDLDLNTTRQEIFYSVPPPTCII